MWLNMMLTHYALYVNNIFFLGIPGTKKLPIELEDGSLITGQVDMDDFLKKDRPKTTYANVYKM